MKKIYYTADVDTSEEAFYKRKNIISQFKADLKEIVKKYNFDVCEFDQYDGKDEYIETKHHFVVDGEPWYNESIEDIVDEIILPP